VKASLIDAVADRHLWGNEYERDFKDVLSLHREVAVSIAGEIRAALTPGEKQELAPAKAVSAKGMEAYLKAMHMLLRGPKYTLGCIEEARTAVRLAPDLPEAHAVLAQCLHNAGDFALKPYSEVLPEAREEARRALELDPNLALAQAFFAWTYFMVDHDWERSEEWFRKAFSRIPGMCSQFGMLLSARGRHDEAIEVGRKAVESDPLNPWSLANLGRYYHHARKYDEAIVWSRKALALDAAFDFAGKSITWSLFQQGKLTEAFENFLRFPQTQAVVSPEPLLRAAFQRGGWDEVWRTRLRQVDSAAAPAIQKVRLILLANLFLRDGDQIAAVVEQMEKDGDAWLAQLQDPMFDPARRNPRFRAVLKRLRYPESMWR
jgi:tetratricopeptide (TPR) repeat protein